MGESEFVHSEIMCFGKYDSHYCVCKQETEKAVVNDVMSVRVLLEARILSTSGHTLAYDK